MFIIDGKKIRDEMLENLKLKLQKLDRKLGFAVIQIGDDIASSVYIKQKKIMAEVLGYNFRYIKMNESVLLDDILKLIDELNEDLTVDGILVQLPIPDQIDVRVIKNRINPYKDVDGLTDFNKVRLGSDKDCLMPCTPLAIMSLLNYYNIDLKGKKVVVVGRGELVGEPVSRLLSLRGASVEVCHSKTKDLASYTRNADLLVVAVGKANLITNDMVKEGTIVIDAGINRVNGKLCGDVDFESVSKKCSYITPVPGGVGPMTIAMLGENIYKAYLLYKENNSIK